MMLKGKLVTKKISRPGGHLHLKVDVILVKKK